MGSLPRAPILLCLLALLFGVPHATLGQSPDPAESATLVQVEWAATPFDFLGPARASSYLGVIGRRSAALGTEVGQFEIWTWPLKLLHRFELKFLTPLYADPVPAATLARTVEIGPAGATISYTHPAFTVRQRIFAPLDEPAIVLLLDVDAVRPIELLAEFQSDLQLAWPGAIGGQYVFWDEKEPAFILSESQRKVNGLVGSPFTTSATNQPAHNVPDAPTRLRIALGDRGPVPMPRPGEPVGRLTPLHLRGIPIVMVGAAAARDSVRAIYRRVLAHIPELYAARIAHSDSVLNSALSVDTPDPRFDQAVRWAALNLDEAMVCNPDLGCGLVAGYGPSEARGTRPGFAWFFGGDAAINALGLIAAGQFDLARRGLEFFTRFQRSDGKIPHEISQSAGWIRWFEDFPYAFYHADTTPYWLMAWGDYWLNTGDTSTIRRVWPNIQKAYEWSRSTVDDSTALMLNSKGGLGAVEVGDLGLGVRSDIYLSAVWIEALDRVARMAEALASGDPARTRSKPAARAERKTAELAAEARGLRARALGSLRDRFWLPDKRMYAFALLEGNQVRPELTVWPSTALSLGLLDEERGFQGAAAQARATLNTDWGSRSLAGESKLFDPLHYNNGTVWPFVTGFTALGQYRYRNPTAGFAALSQIVRSGFTSGLGRNPEVMAGMLDEPLETAVPQQFFGTSFIFTVLTRGLLGWEPDVPAGQVRLAPQLPAEWNELTAHHLRAGNGRYRLDLRRAPGSLTTILARAGGPDTLLFEPHLPPGAEIDYVTVNGMPLRCETRVTARDVQPLCRVRLSDSTQIVVRHTPGYSVTLPAVASARGERSRSLKLLDLRLEADTLVLTLEGPAATTAAIQVTRGSSRSVPVEFPATGDPVDGYAQAVVRIKL